MPQFYERGEWVIWCCFLVKNLLYQTMNCQVGLSPYGAGEVAVVFHVQRVVPFELWRIDRLVHALEYCKIDSIFQWRFIN